MFAEQIPFAEKVLRTIVVYGLLAVLFRLTGKRDLANLNTFDFIVIFLLSNVVQNAVIGNDNSLLGGIIGAVTLVLINAALNRCIALSPVAGRIFDGRATTGIATKRDRPRGAPAKRRRHQPSRERQSRTGRPARPVPESERTEFHQSRHHYGDRSTRQDRGPAQGVGWGAGTPTLTEIGAMAYRVTV
ncbi:MAG TPA: hypothetical protein VH084_01760 [Mycobacterium sp.]|nr:hypothetical protein [Mycobacterium sp.]